MTQPIKISVKGTDAEGEGIDAPTVEDLLSQIQDFVFILRGVERAVAEDGKEHLVWRVTDATRNSPITFEVTPYPRSFGMNIDVRAATVVGAAANGLTQIAERADRPLHFTDDVVKRAEQLNVRVSNGLSETKIDFSNYDFECQVELTPSTAVTTISNIERIKGAPPIKHRELGSIEGFIARVELDRFNRPLVWIRSRLDNQFIKCVSDSHGLDRIGHYEVAEVLSGLRVRVIGLIHYNDVEHVERIDVESIQVYEPDHKLPDSDSIVSPDFTSGLESSAYLETVREDG